jgi:opacity protein-like surface antigen
MKQVMWGAALLSVCTASLVFAQAETPRIDQRQANQEKRIDQGIAGGQLNEREATRLNNQQEHVNKTGGQGEIGRCGDEERTGPYQSRAGSHVASYCSPEARPPAAINDITDAGRAVERLVRASQASALAHSVE